jgi:hypothetical protein
VKYALQLPAAQPASTPKRKWQANRLTPVLKKLYPPDGEVSQEVPLAAVYKRVCDELDRDSKENKIAIPSIDTVARTIGRRKDRQNPH